jgi:hypothetical protein
MVPPVAPNDVREAVERFTREHLDEQMRQFGL